MAQPMSAAPDVAPSPEKPVEKSGDKTGTEKPASPEQIIYPKNSPERPSVAPAEKSSSVSNMLVMLAALALAAGGVWVLIQRRQAGPLSARGQRKLQIEETRPLGGRQYLVVASYDGKKFLLGVTPGKINLLTPLGNESASPEEKKP
jgi:flagellar protein FliO/FliZ